MHFNQTGNLSFLNQRNINFRSNNVSKPDTSFRGNEPEDTADKDIKKVRAENLRAYLKIHTPPKKENTEVVTTSLKEDLTDAEFQEMKARVQKKFPDIKGKHTLRLADKLLSDKELSEDYTTLKNIETILKEDKLPCQSKITEKFTSYKEILRNTDYASLASNVISNITTNERAYMISTSFDYVMSNKKLCENFDSMYKIWMIYLEGTDKNLETLSRILSDQKLSNNENVLKYIDSIVKFSDSSDITFEILNEIVSDERLCSSESAFRNLGSMRQGCFALKNNGFKEFFLDNLKDIISIKSLGSDNFVEVDMSGNPKKTLHIQLDSENTFKIIGEATKTYKFEADEKYTNETKITEYKTSDGAIIRQEYSKEGTSKNQGYYESITDKDGNETITLTIPDKKNPGVIAVMKEFRDKDGNVTEYKQIGSVKNYGENGENRMITKEFESPLKVKSTQLIDETPKSKYSLYEIGDKTFERDFKIKDILTTETTAYGNKYEAKVKLGQIEVTVTKKDGTSETARLYSDKIDEGLWPLVRQLPGDYLYTLAKTGTKISLGYTKNNACFQKSKNTIKISEELKNDPFTFAHEFGHMLDRIVLNDLNADPKLNEIFQKELNAYKKLATGMNEEEIQYFIDKNHENSGGCLTEVIAEANALLSGLQADNDDVVLRGKILQENFPETIKYIGTKIEEAMQ